MKQKKIPEHLAAKRRARKRLVQALYQWQLNESPVSTIITQFLTEQDMAKVDQAFFQKSLHNIIENIDSYEKEVSPLVERSSYDVGEVEKSILLLAVFELKNHIETPYKVILNEAIELANDSVYGLAAAPQHGAHPRQQFTRAERLGEVIICP